MEWRRHPVTALFFRWAQAKREELKEEAITGGMAGPSFEEMAIRVAGGNGYASALKDILDLDYVQLAEVDHVQ